ncbi:hypothetical protein K502DRAFT_322685 [Neoconidiobolus thromboides FSU 785]|nr:hypothetical protein K502DRAFT_322685 [Neoconidiobolus thromboides FSU 785]
MNLHLLPGGKPAFEIRNIQGYGARWELKLKLDHDVDILVVDHIIFRGLLEPPMEDGHTNNWLH